MIRTRVSKRSTWSGLTTSSRHDDDEKKTPRRAFLFSLLQIAPLFPNHHHPQQNQPGFSSLLPLACFFESSLFPIHSLTSQDNARALKARFQTTYFSKTCCSLLLSSSHHHHVGKIYMGNLVLGTLSHLYYYYLFFMVR